MITKFAGEILKDNLIVTDQTQFVIYGAGEVGNNCYRRLRRNGYCVVAAIDKNQSGGQIIDGIYTYKIEECSKAFEQINELVVIICLADGLLHKDVADILYQMGFQYIIFLPLDCCINAAEKTRLTRIYNRVVDGINDCDNVTIKNYGNYYSKNLDVNSSILCAEKEHYTVWLGMEMLFTESLKLWKGDKTKIHDKEELKDKSIISENPYEMLFQYFDLRTEDYEHYFSAFIDEKTDKQKEKELAKRERLYRLFKQEHNMGMRFFIEGAPHVIWNPRNYFNLVGGHHRTMYLLSEGHTVFPVVVSKNDFIKWCNMAVYNELIDCMKKYSIERLYAPLPHPGMLNFPVECDAFGETKLKAVIRFLAHIEINDMRVLDCSGGQAYYARNMERIGVKEAVYIDDSRQNIELALLMNRLLYREGVIVKQGSIDELLSDAKYDVVFAMDHYSEKLMCLENKVLFFLKKVTKKYLIVELKNEKELTFLLSQGGLKKTAILHKEYRNGKVWSTYVFEI